MGWMCWGSGSSSCSCICIRRIRFCFGIFSSNSLSIGSSLSFSKFISSLFGSSFGQLTSICRCSRSSMCILCINSCLCSSSFSIIGRCSCRCCDCIQVITSVWGTACRIACPSSKFGRAAWSITWLAVT